MPDPRIVDEMSRQALTKPDYTYDARLGDALRLLHQAYQKRPGQNLLTEPPPRGYTPPMSLEAQEKFKDQIAGDMLDRGDVPPEEAIRLRKAFDEEKLIDPTLFWGAASAGTLYPSWLYGKALYKYGSKLPQAAKKAQELASKITKNIPRATVRGGSSGGTRGGGSKLRSSKWVRSPADIGKKTAAPAPQVKLSPTENMLYEAIRLRAQKPGQ